MKLKFIFFLLCVIIFTNHINSQEVWQGVDLSRSGLRFTSYSVDHAGFDLIDDGNDNYTSNMYNSDKFSIASVPLICDFITKHTYFHLDGSVVSIAIQALGMKNYIDKKSNTANTDFSYIEAIPIRWAFGSTFAKYFGIYLGVQWMYSITTAKPLNLYTSGGSYDGYMGAPAVLGGNQKGFGGHFQFGTPKFLLRYSYMYDFVARYKKMFKGKAQTHEVSLFVPFGSKNYGAFITYNVRSRSMNAVNDVQLPIDYNKYHNNGDQYDLPEQNDKTSNLMIGVYIEGLFKNTRSYTQTITVK